MKLTAPGKVCIDSSGGAVPQGRAWMQGPGKRPNGGRVASAVGYLAVLQVSFTWQRQQ